MALAAALYGNIAAALVKLGYWSRAEQAASRAVAYCDVVENVNVRRRALYRRALAREKRRDVARAYSDVLEAQKLDPPPAEQKLLKRDMMRLRKLTKHADEARKARVKRRAEEARAAHQRTAGVGLASRHHQCRCPERRSATSRRATARAGLNNDSRSCSRMSRSTSARAHSWPSRRVSQTSRRSARRSRAKEERSLYYDIDVKCAWRAEWRGFDLSPDKDGPRPLEGSIRLYNVSHETRYEPGADPTVAYMYQVGYKLPRPDWFDDRGDGRGAALGADVDRWCPRLRGGGGRPWTLVRELSGKISLLSFMIPTMKRRRANGLERQGRDGECRGGFGHMS